MRLVDGVLARFFRPRSGWPLCVVVCADLVEQHGNAKLQAIRSEIPKEHRRDFAQVMVHAANELDARGVHFRAFVLRCEAFSELVGAVFS
jgi:hypothetical protein